MQFKQVGTTNNSLRAARASLKAASQSTTFTLTQEENETTLASLPAAPEGKKYILDTGWSQEVILNGAPWEKTVSVDAGNSYGDYYYFLASVTEQNVSSDTQGSIVTNEDGTIRFAHKSAESKLPLEIVNKIKTGSLRITKEVTVNGAAISDTSKPSPADGTYTFKLTKKDDNTFAERTITLTITNGVAAASDEIADLVAEVYIVSEVPPENGTTLTKIDGAAATSPSKEVTVVSGATGASAASVTFTNNIGQTEITVKKVDADKASNAADRYLNNAQFSILDSEGHAISGIQSVKITKLATGGDNYTGCGKQIHNTNYRC